MQEACFAQVPWPIQVFDRNGSSRRVNGAHRRHAAGAGAPVQNVLTDPRCVEDGTAALFQRALRGENVTDWRPLAQTGGRAGERARKLEQRFIPVMDGDDVVAVIGLVRELANGHGPRARPADAAAERYRQIIEAFDGGIWTTDGRDRTSFVSEQMARMLGRSVDEMLGRPLQAFVDPAQTAATSPPRSAEAPGGAPRELALKHKDGHTVWAELSTSPLETADGRYAGALTMVRDVSARRQTDREEQELAERVLHAQKLESLGVLAGGIAHDFNNMLVGVLGSASLLLSKLPPDSPVRGLVQNIERSAQRAADVAQQMLAYSGKGRFVVEPVDLNQLVQEMTQLLSVSVSKKTELQYELGAHIPSVAGDATQLRQVIMNLITNGSEALEGQGGQVCLRTGLTQVRPGAEPGFGQSEPLAPGRYAYLEVSDTGCGMDEATVRKIFDPFFTTKVGGRGLGLSAVVGIVRGHGGGMRVRSTPGQGSVFTILLPVPDEDGAAEAAQPAAAPTERDTVLVVDDNETVRGVCRSMLEQLGYRVLTAADGRDGVAVFRRQRERIAGVLLDLTMPVMDGHQALQALRQLDPEVRVALMSGFNEREATTGDERTNLAGFLKKPFDFNALKTLAARLCDDEDSGG